MNDFDDIVISSRIRLARNFANINFPSKLTDYDEATSIIKGMYEVLSAYDEFEFYKMKTLSNIKSLTMLEENIISKELLENKDISAVAINEKSGLSVMLNEEDHIREQCIVSGFDLQKAYDTVSALDDIILENFEIAYDNNLGFLTASPSNLGTGMRASVMLFLPALSMAGKIGVLSDQAQKLGLTVRGKNGENSSGDGYMYQLSNQQSLGQSEEQIIQNVINITLKVCEMEREFSKEIIEKKYDEIVDLTKRAFGILTNAHILTSQEAIKYLTQVRFGTNQGIINLRNKKVVDDLIVKSQPAHLIEMSAKDLNPKERDIYRAEYILSVLNKEKI